uniref:Cohesin loading complex subunit SCC4 homolog n=1 Tax=Anolis carolinensis TaxID=28377 RepID=H9GQM4_ANOCA
MKRGMSLRSISLTNRREREREDFILSVSVLFQGYFAAAADILKHLKQRFPPNSQHAQLWMLFDQKIQFDRAMNDGKYHVADSLVAGITALNSVEGVYRKAVVLKEQNQMSEAHRLLQKLLIHCQKTKNMEMAIRVLLAIAKLYWRSMRHTTALPVLLQALANWIKVIIPLSL